MLFLITLKQFIRSRSVRLALALVLLIGLVSILVGKQFLQQQQDAIASVTAFQQEHITRNVKYVNEEMGLLLYYLRFAYIKQPSPMAALATGQQDVNPAIQFLTIRGLEAQRYDTDFNNPLQLLTGHLDLSFVILFLMPLLIIACCFNLLSQEKEGGTWPMVQAQSKKPWRLLLQKAAVRYVVVMALLLVLLGLAPPIIGLPPDRAFVAYALLSVLYLSVWFAICLLVTALHRSSKANAMLLLGSWLLLCLLLPGLANNYITASYPVPDAYKNLLLQRDGYHTKWDLDKDSTINNFQRRHPQYADYTWNRPTFNYLWYYAMQQEGDDEAATATSAMLQQIRQRQQASVQLGHWIPSIHTQLQYAQLAQTSLAHHLEFLDSTARFHWRKKNHFLPKIFTAAAVKAEDWSQQVPEYFVPQQRGNLWASVLPLLIYIMLLLAAAGFFYNQNNKQQHG